MALRKIKLALLLLVGVLLLTFWTSMESRRPNVTLSFISYTNRNERPLALFEIRNMSAHKVRWSLFYATNIPSAPSKLICFATPNEEGVVIGHGLWDMEKMSKIRFAL